MHTSPPFDWFLKLRLFAAVGAAVLSLGVWALADGSIPLIEVLAILGVVPISHLARGYLPRGTTLPTLLILDTVLLTAILTLTGGPSNPFSLAYLIVVIISAILLQGRWIWLIAALTAISFASLFLLEGPSSTHHHSSHGVSGYSAHLYGMLFSYVLVSFSVVYFISRIVNELRAQERQLRALETLHEKLISVTSVVTETAHQLATPLSSIRLAAEELQSELSQTGELSQDADADLQLLRSEAERCRLILDQLCISHGNIPGEMPQLFAFGAILCELSEEFHSKSFEVKSSPNINQLEIYFPYRKITALLSLLIRNALEAVGENGRVFLLLHSSPSHLICTVSDNGPGIPEETLQRLPQPFYSTKDGSNHMGLGLYTASLIARAVGGELVLENAPSGGFTATVRLPLRMSETHQRAA